MDRLTAPPRVAILGFFGETTAFRDPIPQADYRWMAYYEGEGFLADITDPQKFFLPETRHFVQEMNRTGPWEPVPLLYCVSESGPQLAQTHFEHLLDKADTMLAAAGRLDAVYVSGHGSVVAERTLDTDAALLERIRARVGAGVPILETLDLHGKLTPAMLGAADMCISYQTDPHIDMAERGIEAARAMRRLLAGERPAVAYMKLPLMIATLGIVAADSPFREAVVRANAALGENGNASILPSYPWTDTPFAGFHVLISSWTGLELAERVCRDTAEFLWQRRKGFVSKSLSLASFAECAKQAGEDPSLPALCFADAADNPGGGGTGSTTDALAALLAAGVRGAAL
ncbi:MAG TPA: M81 family metallopeptidase, partial [Rhizomicrobium sp.]